MEECNCEDLNFDRLEVHMRDLMGDEDREFMIAVNRSGLTAPEFMNLIVRPLMLDYGFGDGTVDEFIGEYYGEA